MGKDLCDETENERSSFGNGSAATPMDKSSMCHSTSSLCPRFCCTTNWTAEKCSRFCGGGKNVGDSGLGEGEEGDDGSKSEQAR